MNVFTASGAEPSRRWRVVVAFFAGSLAILLLALSLQDSLINLRDLARWWVLIVALALMVFAVFAAYDLMLPGFLVLVLFVGGGSQLYVTQPLWYPELFLPPRSTIETAMFGLILVQATISIFVLLKHPGGDTLRRALGALDVKRAILFLLLSGGFTVPILNYLRLNQLDAYLIQLIAGTGLILINLTTVLAITTTLPRGLKMPTGRWWVCGLAAYFLIATLLLEWFSFERVLHVADELAYMFQAQTYAGGSLYIPALPEAARDAFAEYLLDSHNGRWISVFTPGWPAVLALGVLTGVPWLVNPILGVATIFLTHAVVRRLANIHVADISTLLLATSPWFIGMSASLMAHTLALFLLMLAWFLILRAEDSIQRNAVWLVFAAGLAMGWMFLSRNLDGLLLGILTGLFLLWRGGVLRRPLTVIGYSAGCIATGSLIFLYNYYFTGDPLLTTLSDYYQRTWINGSNAFGFGDNIGSPEGWGHMELYPHEHSLFEGLMNTFTSINSLHTDFMGWGVGSLVFIWVLLIYGQVDATDRMMLAVILTIVVAHSLYWYIASFYVGPRYWYMIIVPLAFLSAKGVLQVGTLLENVAVSSAKEKLSFVLLILCVFSTTVFLSYRGVTRYHDHRAYNDHYRSLALPDTRTPIQPIVFIKPAQQIASAYFFNDPWFPPDKPIYAADIDIVSNRAVMEAFPSRPILYYNEIEGTFSRK